MAMRHKSQWAKLEAMGLVTQAGMLAGWQRGAGIGAVADPAAGAGSEGVTCRGGGGGGWASGSAVSHRLMALGKLLRRTLLHCICRS